MGGIAMIDIILVCIGVFVGISSIVGVQSEDPLTAFLTFVWAGVGVFAARAVMRNREALEVRLQRIKARLAPG